MAARTIWPAMAPSPLPGDYRNASWGGNGCVVTDIGLKTYRFDTLSLSRGRARPQRRDPVCQEADDQE